MTIEKKRTEEIQTHPTFESLFPINGEVLARIEEDMRDGFCDASQPIILGTWEGQDQPVVVDGHTRLQASKNAGRKSVYVYEQEFETEEDARDYAIRLQTHRRNLSDGDLLHFIERLHERMPRGGDRRSEEAKSTPQRCGNDDGRSAGAKHTADMLNISSRKVEQALTIINHGSPKTKAAVLKNEMSINKAYQKTQAERKKADVESSVEKSDQRVTGKKPETEEPGDSQTSEAAATVLISMEHFAALQELGGSVDEHLASAVERYLESVREQHVESSPETEENDDNDEEYFDPDAFDDDDEEYFDPAAFDED